MLSGYRIFTAQRHCGDTAYCYNNTVSAYCCNTNRLEQNQTELRHTSWYGSITSPYYYYYSTTEPIAIRAVESEVPSSDSDSWQFRLSDSNSDSGPTPTFSCISYIK